MELRTYTGLWRVEKRLYKFYDINLPYPVSIKQVGIFMASLLPWLLIVNLLGVPFAPPFGHVIWLAPPFLITWAANRPVAEGKTVFEYLSSQIMFVFSPKTYMDLIPSSEKPETKNLEVVVWSSNIQD